MMPKGVEHQPRLHSNVPDWQDVNPVLSFDNRTMLMASRRPGGIGPGTFDIYVTTRRPIRGD